MLEGLLRSKAAIVNGEGAIEILPPVDNQIPDKTKRKGIHGFVTIKNLKIPARQLSIINYRVIEIESK